MKKISILLILAILLSSCSMTVNEFLGITPTPTIPPPPTQTNVPAAIPTFTPTIPTPTFTITPTLIGVTTKTSTPEFTPTEIVPLPLPVTALPTLTPISLLPQVAMPGFIKVLVSDAEFFKGKDCQPVSVKITVQVANPKQVAFVVLFVRFKSKVTGATSRWTSIPMQSIGVGTYAHDLTPLEMKSVDSFDNSWVQYQIVSTDTNIMQVGKTDIFGDRLTLSTCVPTPVPTETLTPTQSVP
jgi:hypothetical protein